MGMAYELKNSSTHGFHGHLCLFFSVEAEDNKDFVKQDDMRANFNQSTDCVESFSRMGRLVIYGIDTVLHRTKYFDGGGVKDFVVLNRWQCCHLANELSKMKVWFLQEHQNLQTILPRFATFAMGSTKGWFTGAGVLQEWVQLVESSSLASRQWGGFSWDCPRFEVVHTHSKCDPYVRHEHKPGD